MSAERGLDAVAGGGGYNLYLVGRLLPPATIRPPQRISRIPQPVVQFATSLLSFTFPYG